MRHFCDIEPIAYLRKGETYAELAAGFGVGRTTAWRYVSETVALLAARAPRLRQAVRDAMNSGWAYVVLDGATTDQAFGPAARLGRKLSVSWTG